MKKKVPWYTHKLLRPLLSPHVKPCPPHSLHWSHSPFCSPNASSPQGLWECYFSCLVLCSSWPRQLLQLVLPVSFQACCPPGSLPWAPWWALSQAHHSPGVSLMGVKLSEGRAYIWFVHHCILNTYHRNSYLLSQWMAWGHHMAQCQGHLSHGTGYAWSAQTLRSMESCDEWRPYEKQTRCGGQGPSCRSHSYTVDSQEESHLVLTLRKICVQLGNWIACNTWTRGIAQLLMNPFLLWPLRDC